jgi:fatty acyl-CoA reductase
MDLCKEVKHLKSFVHVSTAYAYCHLNQAEERVYEMEVSPDRMLELAGSMDSEALDSVFMNQSVSEGRPNTYTFTKALAEQYIRDNRGDLPVAIARPSIVIGAWKEGVPGWIDGSNGPVGLVILGAIGVARTMDLNPSCTADLIPVDVVVNSLISVAWYTANNPATELKVYNISTGTLNPITWHDYLNHSRDEALRAPSMKMIRPPATVAVGQGASKVSRYLTKLFSEVLFAYMIDFLLIVIGRKPILVSIVKRMHHHSSLLDYFCKRSWSFPCNNLSSLISHMRDTCPDDLDRFYMDVRNIDWRQYISQCYMGGRRYLLKEDDSSVPDARLRMRWIKLIYYTGLMAICALVLYLLLIPVNFLTGRSSFSSSGNVRTSDYMQSSLMMDLSS